MVSMQSRNRDRAVQQVSVLGVMGAAAVHAEETGGVDAVAEVGGGLLQAEKAGAVDCDTLIVVGSHEF